jgi:hypothetical protein
MGTPFHLEIALGVIPNLLPNSALVIPALFKRLSSNISTVPPRELHHYGKSYTINSVWKSVLNILDARLVIALTTLIQRGWGAYPVSTHLPHNVLDSPESSHLT